MCFCLIYCLIPPLPSPSLLPLHIQPQQQQHRAAWGVAGVRSAGAARDSGDARGRDGPGGARARAGCVTDMWKEMGRVWVRGGLVVSWVAALEESG